MKKSFFLATLCASLVAQAKEVSFECIGTTLDGNEISLSGSFDDDVNRVTSRLVITETEQSGPSTSWRRFDRPHLINPSDVVIRTTSSNWTLTAQRGQTQIIVRHTDATQDQTYMRVYLNSNFDHEFNRATCRFTR